MRHEKIFVKPDKSKVKVIIRFHCGWDGKIDYSEEIHTCEPRKRTFINQEPDSYTYRGLSMDKREVFKHEFFRTIVTEDQINEVKMELWQKLKP